MTKTQIKDYLKQIEKYGGKLITFNSNKYVSKGMKSFVDHIIFYKNLILFIEVKIGKDKLSSGQTGMKHFLTDFCSQNNYCFYLIVNEKNYSYVTEYLAVKDTYKLKYFNELIF